jgi:RNA polymerase sigma-70 factor, ECF subfamily
LPLVGTMINDRIGGATVASGESHATSLSLLERARAQEPDAWQRLLELYGPLVIHWCGRSGLRGEDARDVTQDVFRAVAAHLGQFRRLRAGDTFRGWLWTITKNKLRDHFRREKVRPETIGGSEAQRFFAERPDPELDGDPPNDSASVTEERSVCHRALAQIRDEFEERTWQAFWRATVDGHDTTDIATDLNMTANAVRKAKSRVLHRLREVLGDLAN